LKSVRAAFVEIGHDRPDFCMEGSPRIRRWFHRHARRAFAAGLAPIEALKCVAYACGVERFTCFSRLECDLPNRRSKQSPSCCRYRTRELHSSSSVCIDRANCVIQA
jgi:hypothetical protein